MFQILMLGALMGILGQGARAVVGLKGMSDDAKALNKSPSALFDTARLLTSLMIGFLVGLAAALIYIIKSDIKSAAEVATALGAIDWHVLVGFAASGYVGVDFLEGFIAQYLPQSAPSPAPAGQNLAADRALKPAVVADDNARRVAVVNCVNGVLDANRKDWNADGNGNSRLMDKDFHYNAQAMWSFLGAVSDCLAPTYKLTIDSKLVQGCVSATVDDLKFLVFSNTN